MRIGMILEQRFPPDIRAFDSSALRVKYMLYDLDAEHWAIEDNRKPRRDYHYLCYPVKKQYYQCC